MISHNRRSFLRAAGLGAMGGLLPGALLAVTNGNNTINRARASLPLIKPERLREGDTVAVVNPAGALYSRTDIQVVVERLEALGLKVKTGQHVLARDAYFAGSDRQRAEDLNRMIRDTSVRAIVATRGGWGSARILHLIDYDFLRRHPKIVVGYSDVTALLNAIHTKTGMVTFHGPVGMSAFTEFTAEHFRRVLFDGEALTMENPVRTGNDLTHTGDRVSTLTPGTATGTLLGGNLTVLTSILGSEYVPDYTGCILFTEDVGEELYRVDRMLNQLALNGMLKTMNGFIFGRCTRCDPGSGYGSFTIEELIMQHTALHNVPVWYGSMIGHIPDMFTLPLGIPAEINSATGTIRLLENAVS
jgi:muramoyltetrapeptide carboxypeptidase